MVLFYSSTSSSSSTDESIMLYMGKDKVENELLIKFAYPNDVWFHVDKLSSAHVYLRLPESIPFDRIPETLLADAAQLVKANSIIGNKTNNLTVIYTPASNLHKSGAMDTGQVGFHSDKLVKRVYVAERINAIVNRLNKTKLERHVDHESDKIDREKEAARGRRAATNVRANEELALTRERKAMAEASSYTKLYESTGTREEEDERWEAKQKVGEFDPDDDFM